MPQEAWHQVLYLKGGLVPDMAKRSSNVALSATYRALDISEGLLAVPSAPLKTTANLDESERLSLTSRMEAESVFYND